jgi:hypothetical protein
MITLYKPYLENLPLYSYDMYWEDDAFAPMLMDPSRYPYLTNDTVAYLLKARIVKPAVRAIAREQLCKQTRY